MSGPSRRRFSLRDVRHPMDHIPNEILAYIFSLIILDPEENPTFVLNLTQVCSRWRDLAITTASIWSRIVLAFPVNDSQISYASVALERSVTYPITILLDCRDADWDWDEESHPFQSSHMQSIIRLLLPHAPRWRKLDVLTDTWAPMHTLLGSTRTLSGLNRLESLSLSRCNAYLAAHGQAFQPESLRTPITLLGGAMLRDVSLVGVHVDWDKSPLQNLNRLEFKYHSSNVMPTIHQFIAILNRCPDLSELSIIGWGPILDTDSLGHSVTTTISIPSLKKLSFGFIDMDYSTTLLSLLHVPSLTALCLEDVSRMFRPPEDHDSTPLLEWLYNSQPTQRASFSGPLPLSNPIPLQAVEELGLKSIKSTEAHFARFFQSLPKISCLCLSDNSDSALSALSPQLEIPDRHSGSNMRCLCPSLVDLHVEDADPEILIELVVSRSICGSALPLRNVSLVCIDSSRPKLDDATILRLEKSGIKVSGAQSISPEGSDS